MKKYRNLKRVFGVSLIILGLVIGFIPSFSRASGTDSGTDGDIKWEIKDNLLTLSAVSGTAGVMKDYSSAESEGHPAQLNTPWSQSPAFDGVDEVVVKDGVTSLGNYGLSTIVNGASKHFKKLTLAGTIKSYDNYDGWLGYYDEIVFEEGFETIAADEVFWTDTKVLRFPSSVKSLPTTNFAGEGDAPVFSLTDVYGYSSTCAKTFVDAVNAYLSGTGKVVTFHALDSQTDPKLTVNDKRATKTNSSSISATVTNLTKNSYFIVADNTATTLQGLLKLSTGMKLVTYDLSLVDDDNNAISDFGSCKITLPLPTSFDISKGAVTVSTVDSTGKLENLTATTAASGGINTITFTTTHFSEYGLLYTPTDNGNSNGDDSGNGGNGNGDSGNGNSGNDNSGNGNGNPVLVPVPVPTPVTTPNATTAAPQASSNANDMPKTGPGDELRVILAIFIGLIGAAVFINSFFAKEK